MASLLFYSWGEPRFVVMMILSAAIAFAGGLLMCSQKLEKHRKTVFICTVVLITAALFVFKYFNFVIENVEAISGASFGVKQIALPIGISFYTFQILSYVIDLYKKEVGLQRNFFYLLLYVCFFPQLIAGPIVRYSTVEEEILTRQESLDDATYGARRFCIGLAKKVLISNGVAKVAEIIYGGDPAVYGSAMYWVAAIAYSLQIYFDFSGYSDMAIGLGRIFGFHFLENFNHPYVSLSVTEFWRRWHISLSSWFRDYIYIPLGGNRVSKGRWIFNILVVWALTGLWHGASWNFVFWGLYYAAFLIFEKLLFKQVLDKLPKIVRWIYTSFVIVIGWVIFNITDAAKLFATLGMMFNFTACNVSKMIAADSEILTAFLYIPLGIIFMLPVGDFISKRITSESTVVDDIIKNVACLVLFGLSVCFILSTKFNPFIYFRF